MAGPLGSMSKLRAVGALIALGLAAPVLAGCGSSDEKDGSTSGSGYRQTLDRGALVAEADAICKTYRSKFLDIELPSDLTDLPGRSLEVADRSRFGRQATAEPLRLLVTGWRRRRTREARD